VGPPQLVVVIVGLVVLVGVKVLLGVKVFVTVLLERLVTHHRKSRLQRINFGVEQLGRFFAGVKLPNRTE
jgi:hypothetical protein